MFDPELRLKEGEQVPPVANTKDRLARFVDSAASGPANAEIRKVARAAIELAQAIKHQGAPMRTNAGIAADSVILLANLLRRLAEKQPCPKCLHHAERGWAKARFGGPSSVLPDRRLVDRPLEIMTTNSRDIHCQAEAVALA